MFMFSLENILKLYVLDKSFLIFLITFVHIMILGTKLKFKNTQGMQIRQDNDRIRLRTQELTLKH